MTEYSSRVCIAISTFRNDTSVLAILEGLSKNRGCASEVLIVDSLGTGRIPEEIRRHGWSDWVCYASHQANLGSAGNLAERLRWAAERGHDWVFAVNHDGDIPSGIVETLVEAGLSRSRVGAVYPLRLKKGRGKYDLTGCQSLPFGFRGTRDVPSKPVLSAYWGSSNGTLYALDPVRQGLLPWSDLWMGWEDLGYGGLLQRNGYEQIICTSVVFVDPYEYVLHRIAGVDVTITSKPTWYAYYQVRNLILTGRRNRYSSAHWAVVAGRLAKEGVLTLTLRPNKRKRIAYLAAGFVDGLRGRSGKWRLPSDPPLAGCSLG